VANNTISDYYRNTNWVPDPSGILYDSAPTMVNNLIYKQKSAFLILLQQFGKPINTSVAHRNMCDLAGNVACTLVAPASAVFTNADAHDFTLTETSPARGAGVANPAAAVDIRGQPYKDPPDLGAYVYAATPPEPPQTDTAPPTVRMTHPAPQASASGTEEALTAEASDNVGVVSVQFLVDGAPYAAAQCCAPYRETWDTTTVANGPHTLSAAARDAAGNQTTATPVSVSVANGAQPVVLTCTGQVGAAVQGQATPFTFSCTQPQAR
jgi:hypothetical protein